MLLLAILTSLSCGEAGDAEVASDTSTGIDDVVVPTVDATNDSATPGPGADTVAIDAPDATPLDSGDPSGEDIAAEDATVAGEDGAVAAEDGGGTPPTDAGPGCAPDHCSIGGECIPNGTAHPSEPCRVCLVPVRADGWTDDDAATCTDGDGCTVDRCSSGQCVSSPRDCDDGKGCTIDTCENGECAHEPQSGPCDDGDACTRDDWCDDAYDCIPGLPAYCNDFNGCTANQCDPALGCVYPPNDAPCDDGDSCSVNDVCADGGCTGGTPRDCGDGDACTVDFCIDAACEHDPVGTLCIDDNPCTSEFCDPVLGCRFPTGSPPCDDGSACTTGDVCSGGVCGGSPIVVDDGNPCTNDACDPVLGILRSNNAFPCSDDDACTVGDVCGAGACTPGPTKTCQDGHVCTSDACNPAVGCVFTPTTGTCDDGNACTKDDLCAGGTCAGSLIVCDDGNPCTADYCDAGSCRSKLQPTAKCRPRITVTTPARGASIRSPSPSVAVKGTIISDGAPITSATLNGAPLTLGAGGSFDTTLTGLRAGLNTFTVEAVDQNGLSARHVQSLLWSTEYLSPYDKFEDDGVARHSRGLSVFFGSDGWDDGDHAPPAQDLATIAELIFRGLEPGDITPEPFNVLVNAYDVTLHGLDFVLDSVTIEPKSDHLFISARLTTVEFSMDVEGLCQLCPSVKGSGVAATMDIEAHAVVSTRSQYEPVPEPPLSVPLEYVTEITEITVTLSPLSISFESSVLDVLLGDIASAITNAFRKRIGTLIADGLKGQLESTLTAAMRAFELSLTFTFGPLFEGGEQLGAIFRSRAEAVMHTTTGVDLTMQSAAAPLDVFIDWNYKGAPKLVSCPDSVPAELVLPRLNDIELGLSDDTLNLVLLSFWLGGLLEFPIDESFLSGTNLSSFGISDVAMQVSGMLPPVLDACDGLTARFGDIRIRVSLTILGQPSEFDIYLSAAAPVTLEPVDGGVQFTLSQDMTLDASVVITDDRLTGLTGAIDEIVETTVYPQFRQILTSGPLFTMPLPAFSVSGFAQNLPANTAIKIVPDEVLRSGGTVIIGHLEGAPLCEGDDDCAPGLFCIAGGCVNCSTDDQCFAGAPADPSDPESTPDYGEYCSVIGSTFGEQFCADRKPGGKRYSCTADRECQHFCSEFGYCGECTKDTDCVDGWCYDYVCKAGRDDGAQCLRDTQCLGGACSPGPISRCYEPVSADVGDDCFYRGQCTTDQCLVTGKCGCAGFDFYCDPDEWCDALGLCKPVKAIGDLCTGDKQCVTDVCDITCQECRAFPTKAGCNFATQYCQDKTCRQKVGIGSACGADDQCLSSKCVAGECTTGCSSDANCPGQWCNELLGGCVDKKPIGEACGGNAQCVSGVCDVTCVQCRNLPNALGCNFSTQYCEFGQCKSKKPKGGNCTFGDQCQSGLVCVSGQCRTPCTSHGQCPTTEWCSVLNACFADKDTGASCLAGAECTTGVCDGFCRNCISVPTKQGCNFSTQYCEFNQCKTRKSAGSSCLFSDQCVSGLTCALGTCAKPCTSNSNCLSSEWCDVLAGGCMPDKATGVYCGTSDAQCISDVCDTTCEECRVLPTKKGCNFSTQYCELAQCKSKKGLGSGCAFNDQCLSNVCALLTCRECNDDSDCGSSEFCSGNECKAKKANGKACATKAECSSGCCKFFTCGC